MPNETMNADGLTPEVIRRNLDTVKENINKACIRTGRDPKEVTICAVSKLKPIEDIRIAMSSGQHLFGENYVQELVSKYEILADSAEWHMIGHLQKNKVKYIIDKVSLIHSVDSVSLAAQIDKEAGKKDKIMDVLLEVNIAGEESKWGFTADETLDAVKEISSLSNIRVRGLMTSAPYTEDAETNRIHFRNLKSLFDKMKRADIPGVEADILSMGMTGDYIVAVEEGATMVRVGTGIFGERDYTK